MEGYILIVLQILITGLIIWRRKQDSKEPSGCLAAGVIFMIVFALTTALFSLGHLIIMKDCLPISLQRAEGRSPPLHQWNG